MQIHEALWKVLYVMKCSLGVKVLCLKGVILLSISGILDAISATFCSLFSSVSKYTQHWQRRFAKLILDLSDTLLCGRYVNLYHTQSWSTTSQIYHISAPSVCKYTATKTSKWDLCIQLLLDYFFDKDKYKLSLEFEIVFMTKLFEYLVHTLKCYCLSKIRPHLNRAILSWCP